MRPLPEGPLLEPNLAVLSVRDPGLAAVLRTAEPSPEVSFAQSRTGMPVPCMGTPSGPRPLHSLYDPVKEGERMAATVPGPGFLVCLGVGGGYQAAPLLSRAGLSGLFLVERDPGMVRAILGRVDLRPLLADPRVTLLLSEDPRLVAGRLLALWVPGVCGPLRTLPLRSRVDRDPAYFTAVGDAVRAAVEGAAADFTAQGAFGRRWFRNIVWNLERAAASTPLPPVSREAYVVGAGPSLESQIPFLKRRGRSVSLVAADTAFPALAAAGVTPDIVVSIDCQNYSTLHFLGGFPGESFLALDLSSPPLLARMSRRTGFFAGGHPLSRYAGRYGFPFLCVDTSGGNVGHAAVSLAAALGAEEVRLCGIDFCYPDGKAYARGTYQFDYILERSSRVYPVSQGFARLVFGRAGLLRDVFEGHPRYVTPQLRAYREKLEESFRTVPARIRQEPGLGMRLSLPADLPAGGPPRGTAVPRCKPPAPLAFLRSYRERLRSLPMPRIAGMAGFAAMAAEEREAWLTVLPLTAWEKVRDPKEDVPAVLLERARSAAVGILSGVRGVDDGRVADE